MDNQTKISMQWSMIQQRVEWISEWMESLEVADMESAFLVSNQLDELVMLLANLGIDIRQVFRQGQLARQREEEVRDEHQQWLESLMNRAQSESKD